MSANSSGLSGLSGHFVWESIERQGVGASGRQGTIGSRLGVGHVWASGFVGETILWNHGKLMGQQGSLD